MSKSSTQMFDDMTSMVSQHLYVSQTTQITTDSIQANFLKNNISAFENSQSLLDCQINVPSFSDLLSNSGSSNQIVTQKVMKNEKIYFYLLNFK